jgi:multiple sugar transport system ATP-binding protein
VGTPREVYDEPADTFVAGFLGSPAMNLVELDDVLLGFRPEHLLPEALVPEPRVVLRLRIDSREYLGSEHLILGHLAAGRLEGARAVSRLPSTIPEDRTSGGEVHLAVAAPNLKFFDRQSGKRCAPRRLAWGS